MIVLNFTNEHQYKRLSFLVSNLNFNNLDLMVSSILLSQRACITVPSEGLGGHDYMQGSLVCTIAQHRLGSVRRHRLGSVSIDWAAAAAASVHGHEQYYTLGLAKHLANSSPLTF